MKWNKRLLKKRWFANALAICCGVILFVILTNLDVIFGRISGLLYVFSSVITGAVIAYIFEPLVAVFEKKIFYGIKKYNLKRTVSITSAFVVVILVIVLLMVYLIPQIIGSVKMLVSNIDGYTKSFQKSLAALENDLQNGSKILPFGLQNIDEIIIIINSIIMQITDWVRDNMGNIVNRTLGYSVDFASAAMKFFLGIILAIYFLSGKQHIIKTSKRFLTALLPEKRYSAVTSFLRRCNSILVNYIAFDFIDAMIVGVSNFIFMIVFGMQYSVLISVIVGITNLAPTFGPIVGAVVGSFILLIINPWHALFFLIFTVVLQTIDGYVIKPKLFGNQLGVSSVLIIIFLVVGGSMFGIAGVLLSIPAAAIVQFLYTDFLILWLENRRKNSDISASDSKDK